MVTGTEDMRGVRVTSRQEPQQFTVTYRRSIAKDSLLISPTASCRSNDLYGVEPEPYLPTSMPGSYPCIGLV